MCNMTHDCSVGMIEAKSYINHEWQSLLMWEFYYMFLIHPKLLSWYHWILLTIESSHWQISCSYFVKLEIFTGGSNFVLQQVPLPCCRLGCQVGGLDILCLTFSLTWLNEMSGSATNDTPISGSRKAESNPAFVPPFAFSTRWVKLSLYLLLSKYIGILVLL